MLRQTFTVEGVSEPSDVELQRRYPWLRARLLPGYLTRENAAVWLFYGSWLVGLLAVGVGVRRWRAGDGGGAELLCAGVLCLLVDRGFLRTPLEGRVEEVFLPVAITAGLLAAAGLQSRRWLQHLVPNPTISIVAGLLPIGLLWVGVLVTGLAGASLGGLGRQLGVLGVLDTRSTVAESLRHSVERLRGPVASHVAAETGVVAAYLRRCTEPHHRVLMTLFAPDIPYTARRGFAGGQPFFVSAYFASVQHQRIAYDRCRLYHHSL